MAAPKKSECTDEEWAEYLAYQRTYYRENRERLLAEKKRHDASEAAKERKRAYDRRPEVIERRRKRESASGYQEERWRRIKADPDLRRRKQESVRRTRTGVDAAAFAELFAAQQGKCGICQTGFGDQKPRADHCHDSKQPRGLLCHHCNIIEGMIRARGLSPHDFADRLHDYLQNPPFKRIS